MTTPDGQDSRQLTTMPVDALLELIAAEPAPGCGSAAAVALGLAAALLGKVARRSGEHLDDAESLARNSDLLRKHALDLAAADAVAVTAMVSAAGADLPSEAVSVPRQIGELAGRVAGMAEHLTDHGNPALHADAIAAGFLARAAGETIEAILSSNQDDHP